MNASVTSVDQIKSTVIDLAIRFGPKVLVAMLILFASVHGGPLGQPVAGACTEPDRVGAPGTLAVGTHRLAPHVRAVLGCGAAEPRS